MMMMFRLRSRFGSYSGAVKIVLDIVSASIITLTPRQCLTFRKTIYGGARPICPGEYMKRLFLLFVVGLLAANAAAQSKAAPKDRDEVQRQLMQIEQDIAHANSTCDYDYFRKIEAAEFHFADSQGNVITRESDLATEKDCHPNSNTHLTDDPILWLHG